MILGKLTWKLKIMIENDKMNSKIKLKEKNYEPKSNENGENLTN